MNKGTVIFYKKFHFSNGELGEKLLIILNTFKDLNTPHLCCKTTSKQKYNLTNPGCYSNKNIYVLNANQDYFKLKTWVQFDEIYELNAGDLLKAHHNGLVEIKWELRENTINAIINCIKGSQDITNYQLSLLS